MLRVSAILAATMWALPVAAQPTTIEDCQWIADIRERDQCENVFGGWRRPAASHPPIAATSADAKPKPPVDPAALTLRKKHADEMETRFLRAGLDISVYAEGEKGTTLRLKYALMSRPLVFKLSNESKLFDEARGLGFKRVVFADGYKVPWIFDLGANKFQ